MWEYMDTGELYHHGIPGMKWGVRRFQNKDGSLTRKGKLNRQKTDVKKKAPTKKKAEEPAKKKVTDLSDDELRKKISRMQLEKQAYELDKQISALNPRKVSAGERFAKSMLSDVIAPAAKNAGKAYLEKMLKSKLGLDEKNTDALDGLRKEVSSLNLKKQKIELSKYFEEQAK